MEVALKVITNTHRDSGHLESLLATLTERKAPFGITGHEILEESDHSYHFCGKSLPTIAGLRLHLGVPVHTTRATNQRSPSAAKMPADHAPPNPSTGAQP